MAADEPPYLTVGTDVSAKYRGAFCEAKIKKVNRVVKCKVTFKNNNGTALVPDDHIKGTLRVGAHVEAKHPDKNQFFEAVINKLIDYSQYTVVFDDGDETTLRRTSLCLKSGRHFAESETLDQLPLTNPEHFGTPVIGSKFKRKRRSAASSTVGDDESSEDEMQVKKQKDTKRKERDPDFGKVVCVDVGDKRKKDSWVPALIVAPTAQESVKVNVKEDYLIRSFKDGKYLQVTKKEVREFTKEIGMKVESNTLRTAVEKAVLYLDKGELPPHWDHDLLMGLDLPSAEEDGHDSDSDVSDDEPSEEKDRFVAQLYKFMDERGTPINKAPAINGQYLNLYKLFRVVHKLGCYNRVTNHNQWKVVYSKMGLPSCTQANAHQLKLSYKKYLHSFEDFYRKLGCTMVSNPRSNRVRHRSDRIMTRNRDRDIAIFRSKHQSKENKKKEEKQKEEENKEKAAELEKKEKEERERKEKKEKEEKERKERKEKEERERKEKEERERKEKREKEEKERKEKEKKEKKEGQKEKDKKKEEAEKTRISRSRTSRRDDIDSLDEKASRSPDETKVRTREDTRREKNESPDKRESRSTSRMSNEQDKVKKRDESVKEIKKEPPKEVSEPDKALKEPPKNQEPEKAKIKVKKEEPEVTTPKRQAKKVKSEDIVDKPVEKKPESGDSHEECDKGEKPEEQAPYRRSFDDSIDIGDRVKVKYGRGRQLKIYEAKVLKIEEESGDKKFYVHYTGWNMRYDEWVRKSRIVENVSDKAAKRKKLKKEKDLQSSDSRDGISKSRSLSSDGSVSAGKKIARRGRPPSVSPAPPKSQSSSTSSSATTSKTASAPLPSTSTTTPKFTRTTRSDRNSLIESPFAGGLEPRRRGRRKSGMRSSSPGDPSQESDNDSDADISESENESPSEVVCKLEMDSFESGSSSKDTTLENIEPIDDVRSPDADESSSNKESQYIKTEPADVEDLDKEEEEVNKTEDDEAETNTVFSEEPKTEIKIDDEDTDIDDFSPAPKLPRGRRPCKRRFKAKREIEIEDLDDESCNDEDDGKGVLSEDTESGFSREMVKKCSTPNRDESNSEQEPLLLMENIKNSNTLLSVNVEESHELFDKGKIFVQEQFESFTPNSISDSKHQNKLADTDSMEPNMCKTGEIADDEGSSSVSEGKLEIDLDEEKLDSGKEKQNSENFSSFLLGKNAPKEPEEKEAIPCMLEISTSDTPLPEPKELGLEGQPLLSPPPPSLEPANQHIIHDIDKESPLGQTSPTQAPQLDGCDHIIPAKIEIKSLPVCVDEDAALVKPEEAIITPQQQIINDFLADEAAAKALEALGKKETLTHVKEEPHIVHPDDVLMTANEIEISDELSPKKKESKKKKIKGLKHDKKQGVDELKGREGKVKLKKKKVDDDGDDLTKPGKSKKLKKNKKNEGEVDCEGRKKKDDSEKVKKKKKKFKSELGDFKQDLSKKEKRKGKKSKDKGEFGFEKKSKKKKKLHLCQPLGLDSETDEITKSSSDHEKPGKIKKKKQKSKGKEDQPLINPVRDLQKVMEQSSKIDNDLSTLAAVCEEEEELKMDADSDQDALFLLCEENVPASPVAEEPYREESHQMEQPVVVPSHSSSSLPTRMDIFTSVAEVALGTGTSSFSNPQVCEGISRHESEASAVLDNTPPTTPDSAESAMSSSPPHEREAFHIPDGESTVSGRDSGEGESDSLQDNFKVENAESEDSCSHTDSTLSANSGVVEKNKPCRKRPKLDMDETSGPKRMKKAVKKSQEVVKPSAGKHRNSLAKKESGSLPCSSLFSTSHSSLSGNMNTSGASMIGSSVPMTSYSTLSSSPRPSKFNFYLPLDDCTDADKRIAIIQDRLSELRKTYLALKAEVATIDRRRKRAKKKEKEAGSQVSSCMSVSVQQVEVQCSS